MAKVLAFTFVTIAAGLDDIQLNLDQQGALLNVFTELQSVGQETGATFAKVDAPAPTDPPPTIAPLGMLETAASVAQQPEFYPVPVQQAKPKTMSEAFQAFDALTSTRSSGLTSLSAANQQGLPGVLGQQASLLQPAQPKIHRGPLESLLMDDDAPEQAEVVPPPVTQQQPMVNIDFQQLLGGKPLGVAPRPVSSVTRQQEFLPPVMLQKSGDDDSNDVPATGLWQEKGQKWPKFSGDVFDAYQRGLRSHHAKDVQDAYLEIPSDKPKKGKKDMFSMYKDGISKNQPEENGEMEGFASRLQTEIGLLSHTPQGWQSSMSAGPPQLGPQPITQTAQEHLLKFHQTLEDLSRPPDGWQTPAQESLLQTSESSKGGGSQSVFHVYRNKLRSAQPAASLGPPMPEQLGQFHLAPL